MSSAEDCLVVFAILDEAERSRFATKAGVMGIWRKAMSDRVALLVRPGGDGGIADDEVRALAATQELGRVSWPTPRDWAPVWPK